MRSLTSLPEWEATPILMDRLRRVGYDFANLDGLRTSGLRYSDAVPVLVQALGETHDRRLLESLVRTLTVPWAKQAIGPLIEVFVTTDHEDLYLRWVVGSALEVLWDDDYYDRLVRIATSTKHGRAREMIVLGMAKSKRPEAAETVVALLDDPDVSGFAAKALYKRGSVPESARAGLTRLLESPHPAVRKSARQALSRLGAPPRLR